VSRVSSVIKAKALVPDEAIMRSGFLPDRIIHLHPTRLCNLACVHCYSESSPQHKTALDATALCATLGILRAEGYEVVSLSGGEPLLYRPLRTIAERARELGFGLRMITNGLLATERFDPLLSLMDGVAISFDGLENSHNAVRGRSDAFRRACEALERLAMQGRSVAAAVSLTRDTLPELPDLADHLVRLGVRAIQVRPVARAGRARAMPDTSFYSANDLARLYLVVLALQDELPSEIRVHCDLAPADGLWQQRDAYAGLLGDCNTLPHSDRTLSDFVNPLIITDTGSLKPIAFDFDGRFDVASVNDLSMDRLRTYKRHGLPGLQALIGGALASLRGRHDLVDWFDYCTRLSESLDLVPAA
jgi:Fe-coproporphyrin III synthase